MSDFFVSEEEIRQAKATAVGSKFIFKKAVVGGAPTLVLNTAIHTTVEAVRPDYEGPQGFSALQEDYRAFVTNMGDSFFNFVQADTVNDYCIFSFHAKEGWVPLSDEKNAVSSEKALEIFRLLVNFLWEYANCPRNAQGYKPLLFICRDSVYTMVNSKGDLQICLLPMPYDPHTSYAGMPREVFERQGDISADLYMAAYLYLLLKYPHDEPFAEDTYTKYDLLAERCLSPFAQRRPSLEELMHELEIVPKKPTAAPTPVADPANGNLHFFHVVDPAPVSVPPKKTRNIPQWMTSWQKKWKAGVAKLKRAKGKLSDAQDILDGVLSTEQGDKAED